MKSKRQSAVCWLLDHHCVHLVGSDFNELQILVSYLFIDSDNANFFFPGASCTKEMLTFSRLNEF